MPSLPSRYLTSGAALRASSVGDSSGMAVMRKTCCACAPRAANDSSAAQSQRFMGVLDGASAEAGDDIDPVGAEEIAVARMAHARLGGERRAAQHRAAVEPGRRVVAVRMRGEAGIR